MSGTLTIMVDQAKCLDQAGECIFNNDHWEGGLIEVTKNIEL